MDGVVIRRGRKEDCAGIRELIQELADYEKSPDGPKISAETLQKDGFGEHPLFQSLVAEDTKSKGELIGHVLFNFAYSLDGRSVHLQDLYVKPAFRGGGIGKALFRAVAKIAVQENCKRVSLIVLNWNKPAIDFYSSLGVQDFNKEGCLYFRLSGPNLAKAASNSLGV